jgi:hypothetical protein
VVSAIIGSYAALQYGFAMSDMSGPQKKFDPTVDCIFLVLLVRVGALVIGLDYSAFGVRRSAFGVRRSALRSVVLSRVSRCCVGTPMLFKQRGLGFSFSI